MFSVRSFRAFFLGDGHALFSFLRWHSRGIFVFLHFVLQTMGDKQMERYLTLNISCSFLFLHSVFHSLYFLSFHLHDILDNFIYFYLIVIVILCMRGVA